MSAASFAPGPWRVAIRNGRYDDATNKYIEGVGHVRRIEAANGAHVCGTCDGCNDIRYEDACLIVAAPDLHYALAMHSDALDACIRYLLGAGPQPDPEEMAAVVAMSRAALAKARGETARAKSKSGPQENP